MLVDVDVVEGLTHLVLEHPVEEGHIERDGHWRAGGG